MDEEKEWYRRISMHDYVVIGQYAYFFSLNYNGLYKLDISNKKLEFIGSAPEEGYYRRHLYGAITECNGKLYMPPMNGEEIAVYDVNNNTFEKIKLRYPAEGVPSKFYGAITHKEKVFLIPARYPYLIVIDSITGDVEYVNAWVQLMNVPSDYSELYVKNGYFIRNGKLYMASMVDNSLIKISIDTYDAEVVPIECGTDGFMDMCEDVDGEHIWFIQRTKSSIIKWNEHSGESMEYSCFPEEYVNNGFPFINILDGGDYVYAIAYQTNMSIEINKSTGEMREMLWDVIPYETELNAWNARHYFAKKTQDNNWILANLDDNSFYVTDGKELIEKFYLIDNHVRERITFIKDGVQREREHYNLNDYLKLIVNGD